MPTAAFHSCDVPANIYVNVTPGKEQVSFVTETFLFCLIQKLTRGLGVTHTNVFFFPSNYSFKYLKKNLFKLNVMYSF